MELETQAAAKLDRLLGVLAPTLGAELDRILEAARQTQESEFQTRLDGAIREAKAEERRVADLEITQAVSDASAKAWALAVDATRHEVTSALESQFQQDSAEAVRHAVAVTTSQLRAEHGAAQTQLETQLQQQKDEAVRQAVAANTDQLRSDFTTTQEQTEARWNVERQALETELEEWRLFSEAESQLANSDTQIEMLARFLRLASGFARSVALYIARHDGMALWKSRGTGDFPPMVSSASSTPEMYFRPIMARGKPVAAIAAAPEFRQEALDFLAACLERSITLLGLRLQRPLPQPPAPEAVAAPGAAPEILPDPFEPAEPFGHPQHSEARRVAQELVAEIQQYCEPEVMAGRAHGDLYRRLRNEIDIGRRQYQEQTSGNLGITRDYYHEELVRVLAGNDPSLFGADYPGTTVA